jgi:hypothetical protein
MIIGGQRCPLTPPRGAARLEISIETFMTIYSADFYMFISVARGGLADEIDKVGCSLVKD